MPCVTLTDEPSTRVALDERADTTAVVEDAPATGLAVSTMLVTTISTTED